MKDQYPISDFMSEEVVSFHASTPVSVFIETLIKNNFVSAPIVDSDNILLGMLTEKDCLKGYLNSQFNESLSGLVSEFMSTDLAVLYPTDSIFKVVDKFMIVDCRMLPVVDPLTNELLGIISRHGAIKVISKLV